MTQIVTQPESTSAIESYPFSLTVAVAIFGDPYPFPGPIQPYDFRITYDWQTRTPGIPGWVSANRTITKNTTIESTWGGPTRNSVFTDTLKLKATSNRNNKLYRCVITYRVRNVGIKTDLFVRTLTTSNATLTLIPKPHLFNLDSFNLVPSGTYRNALTDAANRWNNLIKYPEYFAYSLSNNGVTLSNYTEVYDTGNTIASCGPLRLFNNGQPSGQTPPGFPLFTYDFRLNVNPKYFIGSGTNFNYNDWVNVLTHELGHALGIGTFTSKYVASGYSIPTSTGNVNLGTLRRLNNSGYPETVRTYNKIASNIPPFPLRSDIPLEDFGGVGNLPHWQNNFIPASSLQIFPPAPSIAPPTTFTRPSFNGIVNDLMVATYVAGNPNSAFISELSIAQLKDFRYEEVSPGSRESGTLIIDSGNIVQSQSQEMYFCGTCCGEFK